MKMAVMSLALVGMVSASSAFAADAMMASPDMDKCMMDHMKKMDTNGDGMISKEEYMAAMSAQWEEMHKEKTGLVTMSSMSMAMKQKKMDCDKMNMSK